MAKGGGRRVPGAWGGGGGRGAKGCGPGAGKWGRGVFSFAGCCFFFVGGGGGGGGGGGPGGKRTDCSGGLILNLLGRGVVFFGIAAAVGGGAFTP